jgi:hypothetical protein
MSPYSIAVAAAAGAAAVARTKAARSTAASDVRSLRMPLMRRDPSFRITSRPKRMLSGTSRYASAFIASTASSAVSVGERPTRTPFASNASFFA